MFRTILAILLILVGLAGIALGVWGFSLDPETNVSDPVTNIATDTLNLAESALNAADEAAANVTKNDRTVTDAVSSALSSVSGTEVDVTDRGSLETFAGQNALVILLCGIIGVETGLLLFKGRR